MKILILGSQGFIGKHLVKYFDEKKYSVIGCDLVEFTTDQFTYYKISILSSDFENLFSNNTFNACINTSGSGNVGFSVQHPLSDFEANTYAVARVLDTIRKYQPNCKYIHISSAAVYGNPQFLPIKEIDSLSPISPYGFHKLMSEQLCQEYYQLYNIPIAILRPFSVYGEGLKKQLFWDICQKLQKEKKTTLYGTGNESRDFLHISDLCQIIELILVNSSFNSDIYNAASGIETSIQKVADIFEQYYSGEKKIFFSGQIKKGDPINWKADISKILRFDFKPKHLIEKGIEDFIKWYFNNF